MSTIKEFIHSGFCPTLQLNKKTYELGTEKTHLVRMGRDCCLETASVSEVPFISLT